MAQTVVTPRAASRATFERCTRFERRVRHDILERHRLRVAVGERHLHRREQQRRPIHPQVERASASRICFRFGTIVT